MISQEIVSLYRTHERACEKLMLLGFEWQGSMWFPRGDVIRFLNLNRKFTSLLKKIATTDHRVHIRLVRAPGQCLQSICCADCIPQHP